MVLSIPTTCLSKTLFCAFNFMYKRWWWSRGHALDLTKAKIIVRGPNMHPNAKLWMNSTNLDVTRDCFQVVGILFERKPLVIRVGFPFWCHLTIISEVKGKNCMKINLMLKLPKVMHQKNLDLWTTYHIQISIIKLDSHNSLPM